MQSNGGAFANAITVNSNQCVWSLSLTLIIVAGVKVKLHRRWGLLIRKQCAERVSCILEAGAGQ